MNPEQTPYDFITDPGNGPGPSKKSWLPQLPSGSNKRQRMLIIGGAVTIVLVIFSIMFSLIFGGNDGAKAETLKLAQEHTELMRVADIGIKSARGSDARNLATTVKLTLQSSNEQVVAIANKGQKVGNKELVLGKDTTTDEALTTALQTNRFDEEFTETIHEEIRDYLRQLKVVYNASDSKKEKETLDEVYRQLNSLLPRQE